MRRYIPTQSLLQKSHGEPFTVQVLSYILPTIILTGRYACGVSCNTYQVDTVQQCTFPDSMSAASHSTHAATHRNTVCFSQEMWQLKSIFVEKRNTGQ